MYDDHGPDGTTLPRTAMIGTIATITVFAVAQGLTYPLLSFILERAGTTPGLIGLSAAMTPLGFIVSSPFIPALARRLGGARLAILCSRRNGTADRPHGSRMRNPVLKDNTR